MNKTKRIRTQVKDLSRPQKELTSEEQKGVRGGLLVTGDVEQEHAPYQPSTTGTRPDEPAGTGNGGSAPIQPDTGQAPRSTR